MTVRSINEVYVGSPPASEPKQQKKEDFDSLVLFNLIATYEKDKRTALEIVDDILVCHELSVQLCQIENFHILERNFSFFLKQAKTEDSSFCLKILRTLYATALKNSSFLFELLDLQEDIESLFEIANLTKLKKMQRQIRRVNRNEQRSILQKIQCLTPYLDEKRNRKLLILAEILNEYYPEEISSSFCEKLKTLILKIEEVRPWVESANVFNSNLFFHGSPMHLPPVCSKMNCFLLYATPLYKALGSIFLDKSKKGLSYEDANTIWNELFKDEHYEWMDLLELIISKMTEKDSANFLKDLKKESDQSKTSLCIKYLEHFMKENHLFSLEDIYAFMLKHGK